MAFPTIAGYTEGTGGGTSTTVTLPASIVAGDLILVLFAKSGAVQPGAVSGYTKVENFLNSTTTRTALYSKAAAGGETSLTVTHDGSTSAWIALRISGASGTFTYSGQNYLVNTGSNDCPSVTAPWGAADNLVIATASCQGFAIAGFPFSGGTNDQILNGNNSIAISTAEVTSDTSNPGSFTYTSNSNNSNGTRTLIIQPTVVADETAPTVQSATIAANGTTLTVVFDEDVAGDGTGFTLSDATALTYSSGTGTNTFIFTIARTVYSSESLTLEYDSAVGDIADLAANDLATFTGEAISNGSSQVLDVTAPTLSSVTVTGATSITLVFSEAVTLTDETGITVEASGGATSVSGVDGDGTDTLVLSMNRSMASTESLSLSYDSGTGDIEDLAGNALATITDRLVTNNLSATPGSVSLIGPGLIQ